MKVFAALALPLALAAPPAAALTVNWADWTSATSTTVTGELIVGSQTVGVTVTNTVPFSFVQTAGGTNFWNPSAPYVSAGVENAPATPDIIALDQQGTVTVSFSQAIENIYVALVSWNVANVIFSEPVGILSSGAGYWGSGTGSVDPDSGAVTLTGEFHGTLLMAGSHAGFTLTGPSENWHGFTLGVAGLAPPASPVPVPAALPLLLAALGGLGAAGWRRRRG